MPDIFKALASIGAWFLFIWGWLAVLITVFMMIAGGAASPAAGAPAMQVYAAFAVGVASITLSVVVMILRKKME